MLLPNMVSFLAYNLSHPDMRGEVKGEGRPRSAERVEEVGYRGSDLLRMRIIFSYPCLNDIVSRYNRRVVSSLF